MITTIDQPEGLEAYINVPLERCDGSADRVSPWSCSTPTGKVIAPNPITFIAPRADDATQSVLVKATLRQMPPSIRVMQYVRARIIWSNEPTLAVPIVAVSRLAGPAFRVRRRAERQGRRGAPEAGHAGRGVGRRLRRARRASMPGERVIVSNVQKLGDGAPVKPS